MWNFLFYRIFCSVMNPYRNFDHRPLCADHREIYISSNTLNPTDHVVIAPSTGPTRTQRTSSRASPYSSPSPEPQTRRSPEPQTRRHPKPSLPLPLFSSIESLSSELEYDSDRERLARSRSTRRVSFVYDSDHSASNTPPISKDVSSSVTAHSSHSSLNESAPKVAGGEVRSRKVVVNSTEPTLARKHGPPALVFEDDSDDDFLIPKPLGEVGRPGRGGYSLFEVLSWPRRKYDKVKVRNLDLLNIWHSSHRCSTEIH